MPRNQVDFPGMAPERDDELEAAAIELAEIRASKKSLLLKESISVQRIVNAMHAAGASSYDAGGIHVQLEQSERIKVTIDAREAEAEIE
jgi:hypothetical protein